jgi:ribosomal protein L11 methyltransferase
MAWLQIHLVADQATAPLVEDLFQELGALSVSLTDAEDEPILELDPGEIRCWQSTRVTGLFPGSTDIETLRQGVQAGLPAHWETPLRFEHLAEEDWTRSWLPHFRPMRFGKHLWVRPAGQSIDDPEAEIIDLDPGLAFGTGTHATTALCLSWLAEHPLEGRKVLDFGCGSGILAIAALKRGAREAVGMDHDPQAILASRDNAAKNGVLDRLRLYGPGDVFHEQADLVLANILSGTLIRLAEPLSEHLSPGADLLLAGILETQAEKVIAAYSPWLALTMLEQREEWVLLHGRRKT